MEEENLLKIITSMRREREENESENNYLIMENLNWKAYEKIKDLEDAGLYCQNNIQTKEIQLNQVREKNLLLVKEILELN